MDASASDYKLSGPKLSHHCKDESRRHEDIEMRKCLVDLDRDLDVQVSRCPGVRI